MAGKVTTNFQVQSYRGSPVLTWWEGRIELGHGVGEYVIADASYRTVRRVQAAARAAGRPARVRDHPARHGAADELRDPASRSSRGRRAARRHDPGRDLPGDRPRQRQGPARVAQPRPHTAPGVLLAGRNANWDFFHINSVDLDSDGNLLISSRSTHTVYKIDRSGKIIWRLGGKRNEFDDRPGRRIRLAARRPPPARRDAHRVRQRGDPGGREALARADPRPRRAGDERHAAAPVHPSGILSGSQGSVQMLANGNVFVGWGETRACRSSIARADAVRRPARREVPVLSSLPPALDRAARRSPAIAVAGAARERPSTRAGTEPPGSQRWQLLGGGPSGDLEPVVWSTRSRGFESALGAAFVSTGPRFAVQALDEGGAQLGTVEHGHGLELRLSSLTDACLRASYFAGLLRQR